MLLGIIGQYISQMYLDIKYKTKYIVMDSDIIQLIDYILTFIISSKISFLIFFLFHSPLLEIKFIDE